jgi:Outer membrane protein beta-barrel domain
MKMLLEARKLKRLKLLGLFVSVLGLSTIGRAQAVPTATGNGHHLQLGAGYTFATPDYTETNIGGISVYGTYDFFHNLGVEGDMHWATLHTPADIGESSYLIGPRYMVRYKRIQPYVKVTGGFGRFQFQPGDLYFSASTQTFGVIAFGAGVDVRVHKHINVRAGDFESQKWLNFLPHTLSPYVFTFGVAYVR